MLKFKHTVYFANECVWIVYEMLVEERKFFQQHFEFYLVHCLEDIFVVRTEKKELAASATSPASGLTSLIQLLAVLYQIETFLYS